MNEMQIFNNDEFGKMRSILIDNEPWFVGKDIALSLGYTNPQKAVRDHVDLEDRGVNEMDTPSGRQELTFINESGLYALIFGSKLPNAKKFKHWVTSEVLPSIRKTGSYKADTNSDLYMEAARILAGTPVHTKSEVVNVLRHVVPDISTMEEKPIKKDYSVPFDFNHFDNYLKKYGVTTQVLSMKSDVCAQLIYKYRNGKTVPTMETRKKLTEALGIAENYFNHERGGRRRYS